MEIEICKNKQDWNSFYKNQNQAQFLQSWQWGKLKKENGKKVYRLQLKDDSKTINQFQGVVQNLGFGFKYIYFPRVDVSEGLEELVEFIEAEISAVSFGKFEPVAKFDTELDVQTSNNRQPKNTLYLDVQEDEDSLLEDMHSKTRYNIRLSGRKGVDTRQEENLDSFWKLHKETEERQGISGHPKEYYEKMLELDNVYQLTSYYESEPLAANLLVKFGDTLTYLHGASTRRHSEVMATYNAQWTGIKLAKELGCKYYDFWGVSPIYPKSKRDEEGMDYSFGSCWPQNHQLSGVTRFKIRFNGEVVDYPQAFDVKLDSVKYNLYKLAKKVR